MGDVRDRREGEDKVREGRGEREREGVGVVT